METNKKIVKRLLRRLADNEDMYAFDFEPAVNFFRAPVQIKKDKQDVTPLPPPPVITPQTPERSPSPIYPDYEESPDIPEETPDMQISELEEFANMEGYARMGNVFVNEFGDEVDEEDMLYDMHTLFGLPSERVDDPGFGDFQLGVPVRMEHFGEYTQGYITGINKDNNTFEVRDNLGFHTVHLDDVMEDHGPRVVIDGMVQEHVNIGNYEPDNQPMDDLEIDRMFDMLTTEMGKTPQQAMEILKGEHPGNNEDIDNWYSRRDYNEAVRRQGQQAYEEAKDTGNIAGPDNFDPDNDGRELLEDQIESGDVEFNMQTGQFEPMNMFDPNADSSRTINLSGNTGSIEHSEGTTFVTNAPEQ